MRALFLALLLTSSAAAQSGLVFYIDPTNGAAPVSQLQPLPATFAYPAAGTPVGQTATLTVKMVNTSASPLTVNAVYVGPSANSSAADSNFSVVGFEPGAILAPPVAPSTVGGFKEFNIEFTPTAAGAIVGYLQVSIAGQNPIAVSTLSGTGLSSSVSLTCTDTLFTACNGSTPLPAGSSITFGSISGIAATTSYSIVFTLANNTPNAIPKPTLANELYTVAAFTSPDLAGLPASIAPNTTVTFTVIFTAQASAPGPSTPQTGTMTVGSATYTLQGNSIPGIQVTCVYSASGTPCQGTASTFSVGPAIGTLALTFRVTNPSPAGTVDADITLPSLPALTGANFTLSSASLAQVNSASGGTSISAGPVTIQPGYTLTFQVAFAGSTSGTGSLNIPYTSGSGSEAFTSTVSYTLNAQPPPAVGSAGSDLPGITLMCGTTPCSSQVLTSAQQVTATLQVSAPTSALVPVSFSFTPAVPNVTTDPAVGFITSSSSTPLKNIGPFAFTTNASNGSASTPAFTFQTGTTAGSITITATDPATLQPYSVTLSILPSKVQITSSTAVQSSPNLVVTITGYDNTYSAGELSFSFYGTNGALLNPTPISVNAASAFQQYFFSSSNTSGGAFSLQVTFPVSGGAVTQVGSVTANISNSAGQASVAQSFTP